MKTGRFLTATLSLLTSGVACAATLEVAAGDAQGLIDAIAIANSNNEPDTIMLAGDGLYSLLDSSGADATHGPFGLPRITSEITIDGRGATIERAGGAPAFRLLLVDAAGSLTLDHVTLQGGETPGQGGGVLSFGELNLLRSTIRHCSAALGGGGVYVDGSTSRTLIDRSTFCDNTTPDDGGGVFHKKGELNILRSTFSRNVAFNGGALYTAVDFFLASSTLADNDATFYAGGLFAISGVGTLSNTLIAGNRAMASPDLTGVFASQGHNLIGHAFGAFGFGATGDQIGREELIDPRLGPLRMNGGPTPTHLPLADSPAIDTGGSASIVGDMDQRGAPRPLGAACDIGAVERTCRFDLNLDGVANSLDMSMLLALWGQCDDCLSDLNSDGAIDSADLAILLGAWRRCD